MSTSFGIIAALGLVVATAACDTTPRERYVVSEPEPLTISNSYTGKY
jgi:hypothetical protein